jgi:NADH dehydrogenase
MRHVVVLGGGIAGIVTATHLARHLRSTKAAEILLIDHNFAHVWKPMLHTFAAGTANYSTQSISFASHAKRNGFKHWPDGRRVADMLAEQRGAFHVQARCERVEAGTDGSKSEY